MLNGTHIGMGGKKVTANGMTFSDEVQFNNRAPQVAA